MKTNFRYIQLALLICGFSTHSVYAESSGYFEVDPDQLCLTEEDRSGYNYDHCPKGSLIYIGSEKTEAYLYPEITIIVYCDLSKPIIQLPIPKILPRHSGILCISRGQGRNTIALRSARNDLSKLTDEELLEIAGCTRDLNGRVICPSGNE